MAKKPMGNPNDKAKDFKGTLKKLIKYVKKHKVAIIFVAIFALLSTLFSIIGPDILGNVTAFGSWDLFAIQVLMLITSLIIKIIYKIKFNDFLTAYGEGFKKVGKLVIILLVTYVILEFAVMFPILPTIVDWFVSLTDKFNVFLSTIAGLFTSLFTVEYQYTVSLIGSYMTTTFETKMLYQLCFNLHMV